MPKALINAFAVAALLAAAGTPPSLARDQSAALPQIRPDHIVVLKSQRQLMLMRGKYVIRSYRVALGRYPKGPKVQSGDARTPEGHYVIDGRLDDSNFYKAIHISYPNEQDIARAEARGVDPGGQIMIHGLPDHWTAKQVGHPMIDWTQGCIAVTNREMDEIWRLVPIGTPIDIYP